MSTSRVFHSRITLGEKVWLYVPVFSGGFKGGGQGAMPPKMPEVHLNNPLTAKSRQLLGASTPGPRWWPPELAPSKFIFWIRPCLYCTESAHILFRTFWCRWELVQGIGCSRYMATRPFLIRYSIRTLLRAGRCWGESHRSFCSMAVTLDVRR